MVFGVGLCSFTGLDTHKAFAISTFIYFSSGKFSSNSHLIISFYSHYEILTRCFHFPVPLLVPVCFISLWLQGLVLDPFLCLHLPQQRSSPDLTNNFLRFPLGTYFPQSFYIPRCPVVHGSLGTCLGTWLCLCDTLFYSRMVLGTYKDVLGAQMWVKESKEFQLPSEQLKEIQININSCVLLK